MFLCGVITSALIYSITAVKCRDGERRRNEQTDGEAECCWPCDWSIHCSAWNIISRYQVVPSPRPKQKRPQSSCMQCKHVAAAYIVQLWALAFLCLLPEKKPDSGLFNPNLLSSRCKRQYFGRASTHRGAQIHLLSPFPLHRCVLWGCARVCVCAFTPVGPLKGLWFQRRPLYFLHCLATITKASTPLLRRLSTWIACCLFLLFKIVL